MAEALFYQLQSRTLEQALPGLLEKSLAKGWRALVRCGGADRAEALGRALWTYSDESFLPHGGPADGRAERQPIYLTAGPEAPNGAQILFLVDGAAAEPAEIQGFARCCLLFDGRDPEALTAARAAWKAVTDAGVDAVFWAEKGGGWEKKAEKRAG